MKKRKKYNTKKEYKETKKNWDDHDEALATQESNCQGYELHREQDTRSY